jgi:uncharacterized protein (DUF58 family)
MNSHQNTAGVYVTLQDLIRLQYRARGFTFLPRQPIHSLLTGTHASRMRGRGLNFEEIRGYLPGDDTRTIDWKVTARTGKPHVRVFTEERDRPAMLVVDQRVSMFFGSKVSMKSVTAAETAALGAWRVLSVGDRVGAVVFDDVDMIEVRPHRSRQTVMRILQAVVEKNNALRATSNIKPNPAMLNEVLETVARTAAHDYLIAIISDFDGADDDTRRIVSRLAQHNDVLAVSIYDPLATDLPDRGRWTVSDGELQIEMDISQAKVRKRVAEFADQRLQAIMSWQRELGVPVLPLTTDEDPVTQVRRLLGYAPRMQRG